MKAIILEGPEKIAVAQVAEPTATANQAFLRVRMVGLCGSDLNSFRGNNPLVRYPRIPGHEIAATIEEKVEGWPHLQRGVPVTLSPYTSCNRCAACLRGRPNACQFNETMGVQRDGALTEYILAPPEKLFPADLSIQELCMVEPLTVGFHAVARGRVSASDTVAVFGCGGVGLGAVAAAGYRGARTIAIDVDDKKLHTARQAGATDTIHTGKEALHDRLMKLTDGRGPDVAIEAIGLPETFLAAVQEVAYTGRVVYIGYTKHPVSYETRFFVQKEIDILGSRNALPEDFAAVIRMLQAKQFPLEEAVSAIVSLDEVPDIFTRWNSNPAKYTKIMVQVG